MSYAVNYPYANEPTTVNSVKDFENMLRYSECEVPTLVERDGSYYTEEGEPVLTLQDSE